MAAGDFARTVELADGRLLGWAEYGDPSGVPVFHFHGYPGSRLEPGIIREAPTRAGVRLIAIDRPGFGLSSPRRGRRILDWPDDVAELADRLDLERFACMGVSGGGPYALACAYRIPERLTRVAVVCGVGPFDVPEATTGMMRANRILFRAARWSPWLVRLLMIPMVRGLRRDPAAALDRMSRRLPPQDRAVVRRPEIRERFAAETLEALRQGTRACGEEGRLYALPWGFRHQDVAIEIDLYQGEQDVNVPLSMGRWQAQALPGCKAHFYPDEAHLSLVIHHVDEILTRLVA